MNEAKQKAVELVEKYYNLFDIELENTISKIEAKRCAKIAVLEIIEQWDYIDTYISDMKGTLNPNLKYWLQVKDEIEQL
jgi:hypothetical protein